MNITGAVRLRILKLCKERNITINKLGDICAITQSTIYFIASGKGKDVKITTIKKICDGLDITILEFFDDDLFKNLEQEIK